MKTLLHQFWQNRAQSSQRGADIRFGLKPPAIVQAKNRAIPGPVQQALNYARLRPLPIECERGPHHAQETEPLLGGAQPEPASAVGRAKQPRPYSSSLLDGLLRERQFIIDKAGRSKIQLRMCMGVVAD